MPLPLSLQNARRNQQGQVLGDIRLRGAGKLHNFPHVPRRMTDGLKDTQAHGLTEHLEEKGDLIELLRGGPGVSDRFELTHEYMAIHSSI